MNDALVVVKREKPSVTTVAMNRPERRNALSAALAKELREAIVASGKEAGGRVLILHGLGPIFCAGLDLREAADLDAAERSGEAVARLLEALAESPLVTIAAAHGGAFAGGAGLMAACDFVVAADDLRVGFPEVRRGLVPALILTILARQLRDRDLRELLLLGASVDAHRAREIGLVHRVVPRGQLLSEAERIAGQVRAGAPLATQQTKRLIAALNPQALGENRKRALEEHLAARSADEACEGIAAFLEKREPQWQ